MKNVLVLYNHAASASLLETMYLNQPGNDQGTIHTDSCTLEDGTQLDKPATHPALRSADGIQFYHFARKYPATNPGHFIGLEHLEYWSRALSEQLKKRGEKLDGIIIPRPQGPLVYEKLEHWLGEIKERWPDIAVMVSDPPLGSGYPQPVPMKTTFAETDTGMEVPEVQKWTMPEGAPFPPGMAMASGRKGPFAPPHRLRDVLAMPPLPEPPPPPPPPRRPRGRG